MKRTIIVFLFLTFLVACRSGSSMDGGYFYSDDLVSHGAIVLGDRLDNPYTVDNVKSALCSLYPAKAGHNVQATDLYVRFLPSDDAELQCLKDMGLLLLDHPMDYSIVTEGDFYHDPSVDEDSITWQYCVVPVGFDFPDVKYEILDECFLVPDSATKSSDGIDWDAVERESFRLTGNADMLCCDDSSSTKAGSEESVSPQGRITIIDPRYNGGLPFGVAEVRVDCNVFVKYSSTYSDRDGYYTIPKKFSTNPRYRLVFKNAKGFSIGFNSILFPASVSTLGKNPASGVSAVVSASSDRALFRRCAVNNAMYDYYGRCADLGIMAPPSNLCLWMFEFLDASSAVMLHHGTVIPAEMGNKYFDIAAAVVKFFAPDITLGTKNAQSYAELYSLVMHELSHASHFSVVGKTFWDKYIMFIIQSALHGGQVYGSESDEDSGYCAVGESWAYYMEGRLYQDRYRVSSYSPGSSYWFHPMIFSYLEARGFTPAMIFKALDGQSTSMAALRSRLTALYPSRKTVINQAFDRYE